MTYVVKEGGVVKERGDVYIPGNTFHTARVAGSRKWFLGGSTEWPGVEPADVELGKMELFLNAPSRFSSEVKRTHGGNSRPH